MKIFIGLTACLLAATFYSSECLAQFSVTWNVPSQHTTSLGYSNEGRRIAEDPAGNVFIMADATSDINPGGQQGTSTYHYVNLRKYSANGVLLQSLNIEVFNHQSSGYNIPGAFGLEVDASGNVYVGYTTYDIISGYDAVLAKYDNNLVRIWTNVHSTNANESGVDLKLHPSGTLYAVIKSENLQTAYSLVESVPVSAPPLTIFSFPANTVGINSLALDGGQMIYVGGYATKGGNKNAYVAAVDISAHAVAWGSVYTPRTANGDDFIQEVTIGLDGNIYSVGTSYQGPAYGNEVLVLKNLPGNARFEFISLLKGNTYNTRGYFINAVEPGWLYIGAASESDNSAYVFRIPDDGIFSSPGMIEYNPVPLVAYTSINGVAMTSMKVSSSRNTYITGSIAVTGPSGDFTCNYLYKASVVFGNALIDAGGMPVEGQFIGSYEGIALTLDYGKSDVYWLRNYWDDTHQTEVVELIDVNVPVPLRESFSQGNTEYIEVTYHPSSGLASFKSSSAVNSIELIDLAGKTVLSARKGSFTGGLDCSSVAAGIYYCALETTGGRIIKRLPITR